MKKLKVKKIVVLVIAVMIITSAMLISCGALDFHKDVYYYTLKDGWEGTAVLEHNTAEGVLICRYTNGLLSKPKTETKVIGSSNSLQCSVYSTITLKNGDVYSQQATGETGASLVLKTESLTDSPVSTLHYGFANDGTYVAEGEYQGSK